MMDKMVRCLRLLHKILGLLLSVLFLMWFTSGIVMIYHSFPRASQEKRIKNLVELSGDRLPDMGDVLNTLPDSARVQSVSLEMSSGRPVATLRGRAVPEKMYIDTSTPVEPFTEQKIPQIVAEWCTAPVERIDTLYKLDQWIPFGRLREELPIYKFHFADPERHQLYISHKNGRVLQMTDKDERFWGWLGAIPHWVYFTTLRQEQSLWINFVKWSAGIGAIMCLVGWFLSVWIAWKNRDKPWGSPYKKRWFHWHHVGGLLFGIFAATFAFSGMMSLTDIPDWMKKTPKESRQDRRPPRMGERGEMFRLDMYSLDYRTAIDATPGAKAIEWASWNQHPYYRITTDSTSYNIDASDSLHVHPFVLTEEMINRGMEKMYKDSAVWRLDLLTEYDEDYFSRKKENTPLPVYRVIVDDDMHTRHYYNPQTLRQQRIDDDGRTRRFLYSGLHSLRFKFLTDRPILWNIVMYTLMLGGTFLSLTGVVLTFKWIIRKIKLLYTYIIKS